MQNKTPEKGKILKYRKVTPKQKPADELPNFFIVTAELDHVTLEIQKILLKFSPKEAAILGLMMLAAVKNITKKD